MPVPSDTRGLSTGARRRRSRAGAPDEGCLRRTRRIAFGLGSLIAFGIGTHAGLGALGAEVGPPTPRISSAPPRTTTSHTATFGVDAAAAVTLECSLDGSPFSRCAPRTTYRRLAVGEHVFRVRARSALGHAGGTASHAWRIVARRSLQASVPRVPRPILTTAPTRPYRSPNATFAWRPRGVVHWQRGTTFACSLDGRAWRPCRTPLTYRGLRSGGHDFRVRAELEGHHGRQSRFRWTIELRLPGTPRITRVVGPSSAAATFEFEAEDAAGYECRVDGSPWIPCSSPVELTELAPGEHALCVRATTSEGVPGAHSCATWTAEAAPPVGPATPPGPVAMQFSITGDLPSLLAPGSGGPLPLAVSNPHPFDILITELVVTVRPGSSQSGCDGPSQLAVTQSNTAGGGVSILVPANGTVSLPAQGATAPYVAMANLPSNQDACKGAVFDLAFSGTATAA